MEAAGGHNGTADTAQSSTGELVPWGRAENTLQGQVPDIEHVLVAAETPLGGAARTFLGRATTVDAAAAGLNNDVKGASPADGGDSETDPLNPDDRRSGGGETLLAIVSGGDSGGQGVTSDDGGQVEGGQQSIVLLYLSRAFTAWGDRLWAFGLGMFLFRIQPDSLTLLAGYGLARSLTSILFGAALGSWIDRTGRLRSVHRYLLCHSGLGRLSRDPCTKFYFTNFLLTGAYLVWVLT